MTGGMDDLRARLVAGIDALDRVEAFTADLRGMGFAVRVTHDGALPSVTVHVAIGMDAVPDGVRVEAVIAPPKIVVPEPDEPFEGPPPPEPARPSLPNEKALRTGPYSVAEQAEMQAMHDKGCPAAEIATTLNRSVQGVYAKIGQLEARRAQAVAPAPAAPTTVAPAMPTPTPTPPAPVRERSDGWTAMDDLVLVEGLSQGRKLPMIAAELRRGLDVCKERFRKLLPHPTMDTQAKLIRALRAEVAA